jgi:hypothetical protein
LCEGEADFSAKPSAQDRSGKSPAFCESECKYIWETEKDDPWADESISVDLWTDFTGGPVVLWEIKERSKVFTLSVFFSYEKRGKI